MAGWKEKMKEGFGTIAEAAKEAAQENLTREKLTELAGKAKEAAQENLTKEKLTEFAGKATETAKDLATRGAELAKEASERYEQARERPFTWVPGQVMTVENTGYRVTSHLVMLSIDEKHLMFTTGDRFIKKSTEVFCFKWLESAEFGYTAERATFDESLFNIEDDVSGETWARLRFVIPGACRPDGEAVVIDDKFTVQSYTPFERKRKEGVFTTRLEYGPPREFVRFERKFMDCWDRAKEQELLGSGEVSFYP